MFGYLICYYIHNKKGDSYVYVSCNLIEFINCMCGRSINMMIYNIVDLIMLVLIIKGIFDKNLWFIVVPLIVLFVY